ncbi:prophage tail fiber N-terminal domain-containing protein [Aeromonas veronii]|uniref:prophage tail fiber N-terminal domain-containing protein n=1 Tax=Aeromonas veronii TaxID=654 RepID=UPI003006DFA3
MIRIFGTMTDPSGSPVPGAIIELRAISSTSEVLLGSTVSYKCDQQGAYSFQLAIGTYDAYAQNDRCGDMDYLGTARVSDNSVDGDLHSILVDGGINITPPMLDSALAAAQRAESAAALTAADRVSTGQNAESAETDSAAAKTAKDEAVSAASTAVSAKDSIVSDASDVRRLAVQVADQAADVSSKHGDVAAKAAQVSAQADVVSTKHGEVVVKAAQVSDDASATQSAKNISVAAADTATQKAASAATHDASAQDAATRAENAASAVVGAVLDGGECDLSTGVYPQPITVAGKKYSTIWYVAIAGSVSGVSFDVGDILRYTTAKEGYYFKVDAKDDVYSVNGEKGTVTVTPEKIGAEAAGVAQQLIQQHASKSGSHAISGVLGLAEALAGKETAGASASAITTHEAKTGAHSIGGVAGLEDALTALTNLLEDLEQWPKSGSGANGSWIKYRDGTMICTISKEITGLTGSAYGSVYGNAQTRIAYPVEFVNTPVVTAGSSGASSIISWCTPYTPSKIDTGVIILGGVNIAQSHLFRIEVTAIGRWK